MRDFLAIKKALSDETRVRLLLSLRGQELCLCQLVGLVAFAASTVSKHMSILRQSRLVEGRKDGRWMYYRLAGREAPVSARRALQWVQDSLAEDRRMAEDAQRVREIVRMDPQSLCAAQCSSKRACASPVQRHRARPNTRKRLA